MIGRKPYAARGVLAAGFLVLAGACDRVLGIDDLPRRGMYASAECASCERGHCAAAATSCDHNPICGGLHRCVAGCPPNDARCRAACETREPAYRSNALYRELDTCRRDNCRAECAGDDSISGLAPPGCECLGRACPAEASSCIASPARSGMTGDCERAWVCLTARQDWNPDHVHYCTNDFIVATAEVIALGECLDAQSCATCRRRDPFECVGRYAWRSGATFRPKLPLAVYDAEGKPVGGVRVDACPTPSCGTCGHEGSIVIDSRTSTVDGLLELTLTQGFTGCLHAEHPDFLHAQVEWTRPLAVDGPDFIREAIAMMKPATLEALLSTVGEKRDADRAQAIVVARDCAGQAAPGLTLDPFGDTATRILYARGLLPSTTPPTDKTGLIVIANLANGLTTFRLRTSAQLVTTQTFVARAGHLHGMRVWPNPR